MTPAELTQRRAALGLSQNRLAAALGVDQASVNRWESGARGIPPLLDAALRDLEQSRATEILMPEGE